MEKSLSLPFSVSESFTLEPLAKIHCDLWEPSPLTSVQGFKYYVVFVDDCSRFSWFYPLKFKSDFYDIFLFFQKQVENQFNKKIQLFQSAGVESSSVINSRHIWEHVESNIKFHVHTHHTITK